MDRPEAIAQIREACKKIGLELMALHRVAPELKDAETQNDLYPILFRITAEVENIKKRLAKLEKRDESSLT